jgi:hypothetical protein
MSLIVYRNIQNPRTHAVFAKLPIFGKPITDLKLPIGNGNYRR